MALVSDGDDEIPGADPRANYVRVVNPVSSSQPCIGPVGHTFSQSICAVHMCPARHTDDSSHSVLVSSNRSHHAQDTARNHYSVSFFFFINVFSFVQEQHISRLLTRQPQQATARRQEPHT